ncbi:hypothetical protein E4T50_01198 [Aureobasidium sp. EXF-12298]|nr:hypothetical protein E4T50_01198 [Aureobasidium sp. EXF-12298]KAI4766237.1 hypothetical protein E4T51_00855 [Aureobasidium sp. EXF-12344]KAI4783677.1 hypothetical protein E4T52_01389 [Aureobasidium sp. EXF-3400]
MLRTVVSAAPRANGDEHTSSSRYKLSSCTFAKLHLTSSPLDPSRRKKSTQPGTGDDDLRVPTTSTMPSRLSESSPEADPNMADSWSLERDAKLNREYTLVDNDDASEPGYDVIPDIRTTLVEKNPKKPPHPLDHYADDRSYIRRLAERMDFWVSDPAARLRGGKQRASGERSDEDRVAQKQAEDATWVDNIKNDIRCLWDNMGVGQDLLDDELQRLRVAFFAECRETLEQIEDEGHGVGLAQFQTVMRTLLVGHDLKLSGEGIKIMKEMATDKQILQNQPSFTFEEQRDISKSAVQMMARLSKWEHDLLRNRLLSKLSPEQREIYNRQKLNPVHRYFNSRAIKSFAKGKKKLMEEELMKLVQEEKLRCNKLWLDDLECQQKHHEKQVEILMEQLERQKY